MSVLTLIILVMLGCIYLNAQSLSKVSSRLDDNTGNTDLIILAHLQGIGDISGKNGMWVGTRGQGRKLEGFIVRRSKPINDFQIRYVAHLQDFGNVPERSEGQFIGTRGRSKRLEGFAIYLANQRGPIKYNVFYQAHVQDYGDTGVFKNGQFCGTSGQSRRVEAIRVWIEPEKPEPIPNRANFLSLNVMVYEQTYSNAYGKQNEWVGTKGRSMMLYGFAIKRAIPIDSFQIRYSAYFSGTGNTVEVSEGVQLGVRGQQRRLQGFSIRLVPQNHHPGYNIYYQAHLQGLGDTGIYKNGDFCGTRGQGRRVEAIKVWIQPEH